ncbi:transposase [Crenothrix polyspora]|uniref:Transposase n=2 Tax=Crenothrix polyspora TaxID=360316 RepID=A0A1R4H3W3_9GAMM|nr:transposase [Crenothrix polyspora]
MIKDEEEMDFLDIFGQLDDPRIERKKLHPMPEILLLTLCAVICGAESWDDIEMFGKSKLMFLRQYLPYESGVPSDDTLRRFFRAIDTTQFQHLFIQWVKEWLSPEVAGKVVAIDGKTLRGSHEGGQSPIHLVSAFASEAGIVLGQVKTSEKSNEITAIPELLEWLDVRGAIVTIDAMGCQKAIAEKIIDKGGDYLLALKGNQSGLHDDVRLHFEQPAPTSLTRMSHAETIDKGHGRIEVRQCRLSTDIEWLKERHPEWKNLSSIIAIDSERLIGDTTTRETRYFISSSQAPAARMLAAVRLHWGIENQLHWVLDMSFGEDQSRIRKDNAPANVAIIRHAALNMIRQAPKKRMSVKRMRKAAGWDDSLLTEVLAQVF